MTSWNRSATSQGRARLGWGLVLLLLPTQVVDVAAGTGPTDAQVLVTRVLGVRHVVQAVVTLRHPGRAALVRGGGVDLVHASSMLALARFAPTQRRLALLEAGEAVLWATVGIRSGRR